MDTLVYDGGFEGWLCAVFEAYERRLGDVRIVSALGAGSRVRGDERVVDGTLFGSVFSVATDVVKAQRVWKGICGRMSVNASRQLYHSFLSEEKGCEDQLLAYVRYALGAKHSIEYDYAHPAVRYVIDTDKKVRREKHRMEAFVRFALGNDGIYCATIHPDHNVLPLIRKHFQERYADQKWLIYDVHRKYGIYYDLQEAVPVEITVEEPDGLTEAPAGIATATGGAAGSDGSTNGIGMDGSEAQYQDLWQHYFQKVNIGARRNLKLHLRHMPVRYWKFLPEKRGSLSLRS